MITEINVKCFLSLANTLNFTKSAAELFISQQAVSKNISKLEESLETPLFIRDHHRVRLTKAGEHYYELFMRISQDLRDSKAILKNESGNPDHRIRAGYQQHLDLGNVIYRSCNRMRDEDPDFEHICHILSPVELISDLMNDRLDLIVIYERFCGRLPKCNTLLLCESDDVMRISIDYPGASENGVYTDFMHAPFICDTVEETGMTGESIRRARTYIEQIGLSPAEIIIVSNRETAYAAAEQGRGFIITSRLCHFQSDLLYSYPLPLSEKIIAVWKKGTGNQGLIKEYADVLGEMLRE